MTEPTSSAFIATSVATGLTVFGISTGIHPELLLAGMAGALWSQTMQAPVPLHVRASGTVIASLISAYCTPFITAVCAFLMTKVGMPDEQLLASSLNLIVAVTVGLLAHSKVLAPAMIRIFSAGTNATEKWIDKKSGERDASN